MAKAKIYTKTGDQGMTSLVSGHRVPKHHARIEAYGTIDELNSYIGWMVVEMKSELQSFPPLPPTNASVDSIMLLLEQVQNTLFNIGSQLACDDSVLAEQLPKVDSEKVKLLEETMDLYSQKLPELKQFILPGGTRAASVAHVARTVCRRCERLVVELHETETVGSEIIIYLNRLSDYLFMLSRYWNHLAQVSEIFWKHD